MNQEKQLNVEEMYKITIGDVELTVTREELLSLRDKINSIFNSNTVKEYIPYHPIYPYQYSNIMF